MLRYVRSSIFLSYTHTSTAVRSGAIWLPQNTNKKPCAESRSLVSVTRRGRTVNETCHQIDNETVAGDASETFARWLHNRHGSVGSGLVAFTHSMPPVELPSQPSMGYIVSYLQRFFRIGSGAVRRHTVPCGAASGAKGP